VKRLGNTRHNLLAAALGLVGLGLTLGCHSYHIEATIENRTGGPIKLMEVDYPSASFGTDALAANSEFHYRLQTRGSGPISVQYTAANGQQVQAIGPTLFEGQEGSIQIVLLPDRKADFHPSLQPQH
jgi:hypothetical protein